MINLEKEKFLKLIENGLIMDSINGLLGENPEDQIERELISIKSRYTRLLKHKRQGILSNEQEGINYNRIVNSLIKVIQNGNEKDVDVKTEERKKKSKSFIKNRSALILAYVIAASLLIFLIFIISKATEAEINNPLQLTVLVSDAQGNVILENEGELVVDFGNDRRTAIIGESGRTNFGEIPAKFRDSSITIGFAVEGYEIINGQNSFIFSGNPIPLKVKNDNSLGIIKGIIKSRNGEDIIQYGNVLINRDTTIRSDQFGIFKITLPDRMRVKDTSIPYQLRISMDGYQSATQHYYPKTGDIEIRLQKI